MHKYLFSLLCVPVLIVQHAMAGQYFNEHVEDAKSQSLAVEGYRKGSWIAVPIPVSNPTIGSGLQAAVLYLHGKDNVDKDSPNVTSGLGALYTNTETWAVGAFHDNYLLEDRLRFRAALGTGKANLDYYGSGNDSFFRDRPIGYSVKGDVGLLQLLGRVPATESWYTGIKATYLGSEVSFDFTEQIEFLPKYTLDLDLVTLTFLVTYDDRDDNYYPSSGRKLDVSIGRDDDKWSSDAEYDQFRANYSQYFSLNDRNILAARIDARQVDGNIPFFLRPGLNMRGFSTSKYQDDAVASAHLEWRHKFQPRWGLMLSYELGAVGESLDQLNGPDLISSIGVGVKWQVQKEQKLNLGIELGVSEDDSAFYIVIGEKF